MIVDITSKTYDSAKTTPTLVILLQLEKLFI